uniref:SMODS and SLOG-associating 2TM effector domain-containing protein n=1 Tax=Haptolina ericina TaxID=156174 RepID=A0A7S3ABW3_9EUKA|mmetsp:Transcript_11050/g.25459  ORF Transcript_11050/g.25459 Transcript_11050/m.25459 type:complete len:144 (+) Transcript_11050:310-741(+)
MLACTVSSAVLVYLSLPFFVAIIGSTATAVTSWMAYEQLAIQTERYTSTVQAVDNLLSWWYSLGDVEQASTVHIAHLVELGEITLTRESLTLQSFALQNQVGSEGGRGGTGGANGSGSEATSLLTEAGLGRIEPWDDIPIAIL